MPLNGKATPVSKPSWLKDSTAAPTTPAARPSWARKTPEAKKEESEPPKKEVTSRLLSREVKVPFKVEKTIPTQSILKKTDVKIKQDLKEEKTTLPLRETKTPSKSPSKTPTSTSSKSPSTTPSKSPSKTPDYDSDDSDESSYETETDTDETESEDDDFSEEKTAFKPPSQGALKKPLVNESRKGSAASSKTESERSTSPDYSFKKPALKKVITRQKSDAKERSTSPEPKFLKPNLRKVPSSLKIKEPTPREKLPVVDLKKIPTKPEPEMKLQRKNSEVFPHKPSILRDQSNKKSELKL